MGIMGDYRIVLVYTREGIHKNYQLSFTGIPYISSIFNLLYNLTGIRESCGTEQLL